MDLMEYDKKKGWRGPIQNSYDKLISDLQISNNNHKNPFPKKWKLSQVIGAELNDKYFKD